MTGDEDRLVVRRLSEADDVDALNAGNPLGWQAELWRRMEAGGDAPPIWFVGLLDGRPAGLAAALPYGVMAGGDGGGIVTVLPDARRQGLGSALRAAVEDACRGRVPGVLYRHFEGYADTEAAVAAWGLEETGRHRNSVLDLTAIDRTTYAARADLPDVELFAPAAFDEIDEAAWRELHAFLVARMGEAPDLVGGEPLPYATFRHLLLEPWMLLLARVDGELAGVSMIIDEGPDPTSVNTYFTGVLPAARGRGLATAMKCRHALLLADRGIRVIHTQNMDGNESILAANRTMGYVLESGFVDVRQALPVLDGLPS